MSRMSGQQPVPLKMRPILRFSIAFIASLGLAGMACAAPSGPSDPGSVTAAPANVPATQGHAVLPTEKVHESTSAHAERTAHHKPPARDPKAARIFDVEGVGAVTVYAAQGTPRGLALFASGDGGWELGVWDMAQTAASLGYVVAGFSTPALLKSLDSGTGACSDAAAAFEKIGNEVKAALKLPDDFRPLLIGYSSGATVVYAALAQSGDKRFSGAMTLGFCPDLIYHKPFCQDTGLTADKQHKPPYGFVFNTVPRVPAPWIVLQGDIDKVCSPPATVSFVEKVKNGKVISLPHVGHGYGVPRNWMPQYRTGLIELLRAAAPEPRVAERNR